ncbi:titin-like protein [Harp seal herpesvirus]|uniref:Titin-like protein n=1 Tax=phocid gammaherpesvirus 3 TaxID=2560643 RepID=A0A0R5WUQ1_9GAMA|nr:titin-like protein [Harp seal herpesvirus]AJG42975.1 titin-like protein [Harp seal herpesvirus]
MDFSKALNANHINSLNFLEQNAINLLSHNFCIQDDYPSDLVIDIPKEIPEVSRRTLRNRRKIEQKLYEQQFITIPTKSPEEPKLAVPASSESRVQHAMPEATLPNKQKPEPPVDTSTKIYKPKNKWIEQNNTQNPQFSSLNAAGLGELASNFANKKQNNDIWNYANFNPQTNFDLPMDDDMQEFIDKDPPNAPFLMDNAVDIPKGNPLHIDNIKNTSDVSTLLFYCSLLTANNYFYTGLYVFLFIFAGI